MSNFDQKSQFLRKPQKKKKKPNIFLPIFVQNGLKIDKDSENEFWIAFRT